MEQTMDEKNTELAKKNIMEYFEPLFARLEKEVVEQILNRVKPDMTRLEQKQLLREELDFETLLLTNDNLQIVLHYFQIDELIKDSKKANFLKRYGVSGLNQFNLTIEDAGNPIYAFVTCYGFDNIVHFDEENNHFFSDNHASKLKEISELFLDYETNRDYHTTTNSKQELHFKTAYLQNGNIGNLKYSYSEFEEAVWRIIVYGQAIVNPTSFSYELLEETPFQKKYPELFLGFNAPELLRTKFYAHSLTPKDILEHPEWSVYLQDKLLENCFQKQRIDLSNGSRTYFYDYVRTSFSNEDLLSFFEEYGLILSTIFSSTILPEYQLKEQLKEQLIQFIYDAIVNGTVKVDYSKQVPQEFKERYPDLFLTEPVLEEIQTKFYLGTLSFYDLIRQPSLLQLLPEKNIDTCFQRTTYQYREYFKLFGIQEGLKLGKKHAETVSYMVESSDVEVLLEWYQKLNRKFVPHYIVMVTFPRERIDQFIAANKKWSRLMQIPGYNLTDETKAAILKAGMCFGVFDNDENGYRELIDLFAGIPHDLTETNIRYIESYFFNLLERLKTDTLSKELTEQTDLKLAETKQRFELINRAYQKDQAGRVKLKESVKEEKQLISQLRKIFEEIALPKMMTPNIAHDLFGGFDMRYDPDFLEFLIANMEKILGDDEFIYRISTIQRQFTEIQRLNCNRPLTLERALNYVENRKYRTITVGNEQLGTLAGLSGYGEFDFEQLQKIYFYSRMRTSSSIPYLKGEYLTYQYELLRLDDPLSLVIGTLTNCCQKLDDVAESSMIHSAVSQDGRIMLVKDQQGNVVAQSWVWRNGNVICFDNIEIPNKAFTRAEKIGMSPETFSDQIYEVYQTCGRKLMNIDHQMFQTLYHNQKIDQLTFDKLKVAKVTVGKGYNDIAKSLENHSKLSQTELTKPPEFLSPIRHNGQLYINDSRIQYVLVGEDSMPSNHPNLPIYTDPVPIYENATLTQDHLYFLQKLEKITEQEEYDGKTAVYDYFDEDTPHFVDLLASNYALNKDHTKVIISPNYAIIYDQYQGKVRLGDILFMEQLNNGLMEVNIREQLKIQLRIALEQLNQLGEIDYSRLEAKKFELYQEIRNEDKKQEQELLIQKKRL